MREVWVCVYGWARLAVGVRLGVFIDSYNICPNRTAAYHEVIGRATQTSNRFRSEGADRSAKVNTMQDRFRGKTWIYWAQLIGCGSLGFGGVIPVCCSARGR